MTEENQASSVVTPRSRTSGYVSNPHPVFTVPDNIHSRPAFIRAAMKQASSVDVARSEIFYTVQPVRPDTLLPVYRQRRMNEHRAAAIRALTQAMIFHVNIATGMVMASVTQLSEECGLTAHSVAGNASISRCCRAILHLEQYGLLRCQKIWDRVAGMYIPKIIQVTELFFVMTGLESGKYEAAQRQQLGWINQGLLQQGEAPLTLTEARRRAREQHIHRAFEHRKKTQYIRTQQKRARLLMEQEEAVARSQILTGLVARYSKDELQAMGHAGLKKQVSQLYHQMRKLASTPPPDTPVH